MTRGADPMPAEAAEVLSVRDLRVSFGTGEETVHAVRGIDLDLGRNQTLALVGESGSGKSVTALAIMRLLPPGSVLGGDSRVLFCGRDLVKESAASLRALRGAEISMIFQDPVSALNPVFSAGFQLAEVLVQHRRLSRRQARARAIELLHEVGIPQPQQRVDAYPFQLSGGQQQRVMIAMAIACEPKVLIADEPTTALDVTVQKQIMQLLGELKERHRMSMLFISHDLELVGDIADRIAVMRAGRIVEEGTARHVLHAATHPYSRALIACRPSFDARPRRLPSVEDFMAGSPGEPATQERSRGLRGDEEPLLEARGLAKVFPVRAGFLRTSGFEAVNDVSFILPRGKTLGLVGESGSGKTTLARMIARLVAPSRGRVIFEGTDLLSVPAQRARSYKRRIQIVFQNPYASLNPRFTAGEILMEPMRIHGIGANEVERREMAEALLQKVGMTPAAFPRYPHEFSGGQRQRIAVARCLTLKPDVLICDEAVSSLDVSVQAQLLNLLQDLQDEYAMSYLFISHDLAVVRYMADRVLVMHRGKIVEAADSSEIYLRPRHPYTKELLSSVPGARARLPH